MDDSEKDDLICIINTLALCLKEKDKNIINSILFNTKSSINELWLNFYISNEF